MTEINENKGSKLLLNRQVFSELTRLAGVKHIEIESATAGKGGVALRLHSTMTSCACPICGRRSRRVHSRYDRTLMSLPMLGKTVTVTFSARRFHCDNDRCVRKVFF